MSKEHLASFLTEACRDPDLGRSLREQESIEDLVSLGSQKGFEFTAEELAMLSPEKIDLSDEELDSVTGGNPMSTMHNIFNEANKSLREDVDYFKKNLGL